MVWSYSESQMLEAKVCEKLWVVAAGQLFHHSRITRWTEYLLELIGTELFVRAAANVQALCACSCCLGGLYDLSKPPTMLKDVPVVLTK